jgi:PAS domain S-box-containing protein
MVGARIAGAALLVLGIVGMLGWLLQSPALLRLLLDPSPMTFNTALCFGLCGVALLVPPAAGDPRVARIPGALGGLVAAIALLVLAEHLLRVDLGIDWRSLHQWRPGGDHPGRMAVASAAALLLGGIALILMVLPDWRHRDLAVRSLALCVGLIGAVGLGGYLVGANLLFPDYRTFGSAGSTAAGLILLAVGLRFFWQRYPWGRAAVFEREDDRIAFASAAVLALVALAAVLATFGMLQERVQALVKDHVQAALKSRSEVFRDLILLRESGARSAALRPAAAGNLRAIRAGRDDGSNLANLNAVVASFLKLEFSAIAYLDPEGKVVASGGRFAQAPAIAVPLKTAAGATLLWNDGLFLRNRFAVHDSQGGVGEVLTEQPLAVLTQLVRDPAGSGATWDMGLCVRREQELQCFPQRLNPKVFSTPLANLAGEPLPMTRALRGESASIITRDYRAQNVLAAYGPVGDTGLGMVVKVDTAEVFGPIREQLLLAVGLLLATIALGALLVRFRVMPLATRLQGALDERAAGLHRAQQMAKLSHVVTRPDGSFETWSETLPALIGVDAAAMPASTREWLQFVHPDDRHVFRKTAIDAGAKGVHSEVAYRLRRADGEWIHVQQTMEPLGGEAGPGARNRWFNTIQDITEQKRSEARISRLNRVYSVLSAINSMIVRVDDRDRLFSEACRIAVEQGGLRLAYVGLVDKAAQCVRPVAWAGDDPGFARLERPLGAVGGKAWEGGASRAVSSKWSVVQNDIAAETAGMTYQLEALKRGYRSVATLPLIVSGEAIGVLGLYAGEAGFFDWEEVKLLEELAGDISFAVHHLELNSRVKQRSAELNKALEDLRRSEAGLERRVEERTAELKAANNELEAFSYSVSHDLRAPLRHIAGFADMLQEESGAKLDADSRRYLGVIVDSVNQMGRLIDDLLLFSRMGRVEMRQETVAMAPLAAGVVKALDEQTREQEPGRRIEWDVGPLPEVRGDPSLLRQVWVNLLSNAVKYSRQRDPAKIGVHYDTAAGEFVVRDNGAGFDMRYAEKLFGVFQRLHRAEEFEGTGIGLANVKRIITRHGGQIRAQGKAGEGAEFRFTLPLHNGEPA